MLLGTYHFANPGLDAVKVTQRDTLGTERQKEIAELVDRLAKFKPTKLLVEVTPEQQVALDAQFQDYLADKSPLTASETQQVGFRLARRFGARIVGVDYKSDMDFDRVLGFASAHGMQELPQKMGKTIELIGKAMTDMDRRFTVSQILAIHNDPLFQRQGQGFYTDFLRVAKAPEYPGADLIAAWYRRNLVIYQNVVDAVEPGDRALLIYGSGHVYYLHQLLADSASVDLADVRKLLPKPPINEIPGF